MFASICCALVRALYRVLSTVRRRVQERDVSRREAEAWARSKGMLFIETSAKTRVGIVQVFNELLHKARFCYFTLLSFLHLINDRSLFVCFILDSR